MKQTKLFKLFTLITFYIIILNNYLYGQWVRQPVPKELGVALSVSFLNSQTGIGGGWKYDTIYTGGGLIFTTNGGTQWNLSQFPDSLRSAVTCQIISNIAYCCGAYNINGVADMYSGNISKTIFNNYDLLFRIKNYQDTVYKGYFLKSTDMGQSWFPINSIPNNINYLLGMDFIDVNTGYITGDKSFGTLAGIGAILKTTNGGSAWTDLNIPDTIAEVRNIDFIDVNTGYGAAFFETGIPEIPYKGAIIKTTNAGVNWFYTEFSNVNTFNDIKFSNAFTGYACGTGSLGLSGVIYKTTDSGNNWELIYEMPYAFFLTAEVFNNVCLVSGLISNFNSFSMPLTVTSTNSGNNWSVKVFNDTTHLFSNGFIIDNNNWYLCGGNFTDSALIYYSDNAGENGIENNNILITDDFKLYDNYPNPFNPVTTIKFSISKNLYGQNTDLTIYNSMGQKITTIINRFLPAGTYEMTWNAVNHPSGLYIVILTFGGKTSAKKIVYIK